MAPVYIKEQGSVVRRRGERLIVTYQKKQLLDLPLIHLDQIVLFGNVQITSQAVAMLLQKEIDVVFLSQYGTFRGRLMHTGSRFAQLRHAQLKKLSDDAISLRIAKQVVFGKLQNQNTTLKTWTGNDANELLLQQSRHGINRLSAKAKLAKNPDSLRGFEGSAGVHYWRGFRTTLKTGFGFQGRKYFPPPDPINALLSFGYALLQKDVTAAVQLVGLDPYLGFFHTIHYGRPSLSLDLMEEFRPVLVDSMVMKLVNKGLITNASFEKTSNPKRPVRLTDQTTDLLIQYYETMLGQRHAHTDAGGQTTLRRIIELQVRRLAKVILGKQQNYAPFIYHKG